MGHDEHPAVLGPPGPAEEVDLLTASELEQIIHDSIEILARLLGRHVPVGPGGAAEAPGIEGKDIEPLPRQDVHEAIRRLPRHLQVKALPARSGRAVRQDDDGLARWAAEVLFPDRELESGLLHPMLHPTDLLRDHRRDSGEDGEQDGASHHST